MKVLDGRAVNGRFWVFAASMSDRPFTLTIVDTAGGCLPLGTCQQRQYTEVAGHNRNFIDVGAFPSP